MPEPLLEMEGHMRGSCRRLDVNHEANVFTRTLHRLWYES
jgi:hypothetical protein